MAISTAGTFLYYNAGTAETPDYEKLVDIISYPDMGSSPNKIDTTDLSQTEIKTNILGLQEAPDLTFECNYDETAYETIEDMNDTYTFQLWFGTSGENGIFEWDGQVSVHVVGAGVDEARKMQVTVSSSTAISKV